MRNLIGKVFVNGKIELKTGLHIGGASTFDIGGIDNPIMRDAQGVPFIPGSSLKGKMRFLLEWKEGRFKIMLDGKRVENLQKFWDAYLRLSPEERKNIGIEGGPCDCGQCNVCKLFGTSVDSPSTSFSRLIVRDAHLDIDSFNKLFENKDLESPYGEVKYENTIDRITSTANPRQVERVPAGASFDFQFVVSLFGDEKEDKELLTTLFTGMKLLEDDYIGGSGTRGYGQIQFKDIDITLRDRAFYELSSPEEKRLSDTSLDDLSQIDINKINDSLKDLYQKKQNPQGDDKS